MAAPPDDAGPTAEPAPDGPSAGTDPSGSRRLQARADQPPTALPSVTARVLGFLAILVAGAIGGFIGYGFTDLQCHGDCTTPDAIGVVIGATVAAVGVAIVVVLALRAMGEWHSIQRRPTGPDRPATPPSKRPRVR